MPERRVIAAPPQIRRFHYTCHDCPEARMAFYNEDERNSHARRHVLAYPFHHVQTSEEALPCPM